MIFDDSYQSFGQPKLDSVKIENMQTSLDNYMQQQQAPIQKNDLQNIYQTYELRINKDFFNISHKQKIKKNNHSKHYYDLKSTEESGSTRKQDTSPQRLFHMNSFDLEEILQPSQELSPQSKNGYTSIVGSQTNIQSNLKNNPFRINKTHGSFRCFKNSQSLININFKSEIFMKENQPPNNLQNNFEDLVNKVQFDKKTKKNQQQTCQLCTGNFIYKDIIAQTNSCQHNFHKKCLESWLKKLKFKYMLKCPKCDHNL